MYWECYPELLTIFGEASKELYIQFNFNNIKAATRINFPCVINVLFTAWKVPITHSRKLLAPKRLNLMLNEPIFCIFFCEWPSQRKDCRRQRKEIRDKIKRRRIFYYNFATFLELEKLFRVFAFFWSRRLMQKRGWFQRWQSEHSSRKNESSSSSYSFFGLFSADVVRRRIVNLIT